jgi:hypothetical protein
LQILQWHGPARREGTAEQLQGVRWEEELKKWMKNEKRGKK